MIARLTVLVMTGLLSQHAACEEDEFGLGDAFGLDIEEIEKKAPVYRNTIDLSLKVVSGDNFQFGKYNDLTESGFLLDSNVELISPAAGDIYWSLTGLSLATHARDMLFTMDRKRSWLTVQYQEISTRLNDDGRTPYRGKSAQLLPADWTGGLTTADFQSNLISKDVENELLRQQLTVEIEKLLLDNFWAEASVKIEEKEGSQLKGTSIYFNAANPQAVLLPVPVDQRTTDIGFRAGYEGRTWLISAGYRYTGFDNRYREVTWQNPYANGFGPAVDYPAGFGGLAVAPDYAYQEVTFSGAVTLSDTLRIVADGLIGESRQEDSLPDFTVNPLLTVNTALPVSKVDDPLITRMFHAGLYARPFRRLSLNAHYRYRERENEASRYPWQYVRGDGFNQPGAQFSVFNRPLDYEKDEVELEGLLTFRNRSRLILRYQFEETYREFAAVEDTDEETFNVEYRMRPSGKFSHRITLNYANLEASTYEWSRSFFQLLAVDLINQVPDDQRWINHPSLRQYHLANRTDKGISWRTDYRPRNSWLLQLAFETEENDYDKSALGLTGQTTDSANLGFNYSRSKDLSVHGYVDYNRVTQDQTGRDFGGGINKAANVVTPPLPQGSDPLRNFEVLDDNTSLTTGLGLHWQIDDRILFDANYTYLRVERDYDVSNLAVTGVGRESLPSSDITMHDISLRAAWEYSSQITLGITYNHYRYEDNDWSREGIGISTLAKVLTTGQQAPNENVNVVALTMSFKY